MNVAFDIDGTVTDAPDVFAAVTAALTRAGHHVFVVTAYGPGDPKTHGDQKWRQEQLAELGLNVGRNYERVYIAAGDTKHDVANEKRDICKMLNVRLFVDNSVLNCRAVSETALCLLVQDRPGA